MASNPKLPDYPPSTRPRPGQEPGKVKLIRQRRFPWPILALIAGIGLLVTLFALLPKLSRIGGLPSAAEGPQQPTADQVQFTHLKISPAATGGAVYLTAMLHNTGNSAITGVEVQAQFLGRNGPVLASETKPVEGLSGAANTGDLAQAPIKPNESRPVRIYFEHTPKGWNRQLPELTVTTVKGTAPGS